MKYSLNTPFRKALSSSTNCLKTRKVNIKIKKKLNQCVINTLESSMISHEAKYPSSAGNLFENENYVIENDNLQKKTNTNI